jgi:folate-binding Fe-S cluster repair protein YgfZ
MSIIETNIASEVAQEPTGPTNTVEIPVQETKIDTIAKAKLQAEALSTFTNKTLVQTADQVYKAPKVKEFVTKITGGKTFEAFDGAYEECKIQLIPAGTNFNKEAFIPSASNVDSKATSIRRDVGNL